MVPVFKNVAERSRTKSYRPVSLLRILDDLEKCGLFSDFQYSFRSSQLTPDLLTVVSDRIARDFNKSGAT